jgi:hypothetical protein
MAGDAVVVGAEGVRVERNALASGKLGSALRHALTEPLEPLQLRPDLGGRIV